MSRTTQHRVFKQWKDGGRNIDAVRLRYVKSTRSRVTTPLLLAFVRICGDPGIRSCIAAFRKLETEWNGPLPVTYSTLLRYIGREKLDQLQRYHHAVAESEAALASAKQDRETSVLRVFQSLKRPAA